MISIEHFCAILTSNWPVFFPPHLTLIPFNVTMSSVPEYWTPNLLCWSTWFFNVHFLYFFHEKTLWLATSYSRETERVWVGYIKTLSRCSKNFFREFFFKLLWRGHSGHFLFCADLIFPSNWHSFGGKLKYHKMKYLTFIFQKYDKLWSVSLSHFV